MQNWSTPPDYPDGVRIAIEKVQTETGDDIQLNHPHLKVTSNHGYTVHFRAWADRPRSVFLTLSLEHEPWTSLGLCREIALTSEWQGFQEEFTAKDDDNARIHFDVGGSDISVEVSTLFLVAYWMIIIGPATDGIRRRFSSEKV